MSDNEKFETWAILELMGHLLRPNCKRFLYS
jgi:hypothetical protein